MCDIKEFGGKARNLAAIAAFFVVVIHCRPSFAHGSCGWWLCELIGNGFAEAAVPFFFLVSGYFLLNCRINTIAGYVESIRKRVRTLLVPWCFWNLAAMCLIVAVGVNGMSFENLPALADVFGFNRTGFPMVTPLWYLRAVFVFVLISPLIHRALARWGGWVLAIEFVVYWTACPYYPLSWWGPWQEITRCGWLPVLGLFYFTAGMALRTGKLRLPNLPASVSLSVGAVLVAVRAVMEYLDFDGGCYFGMLSIPLLLNGLFRAVPSNPVKCLPISYAFVIYVTHKIGLVLWVNYFGRIDSMAECLLIPPALCLVAVVFAQCLRRLSPTMARVIFGGR